MSNASRISEVHVLIADDYEELAMALAAAISDAEAGSITTSLAFNGEQAVAFAVRHETDVVLLDVNMPVMNGIDAAFGIREAMGHAAPLLVAMTGDSWRLSHSERQAFDHVLEKPIDIEAFLALLPRPAPAAATPLA